MPASLRTSKKRWPGLAAREETPPDAIRYSFGDRNLASKYRLPTATGLSVNPIALMAWNIVYTFGQANLTDGTTRRAMK